MILEYIVCQPVSDLDDAAVFRECGFYEDCNLEKVCTHRLGAVGMSYCKSHIYNEVLTLTS